MKKTLIITGIILAVILAALVAVPLFFKDSLIEKTKTAINNNLNAKVEFRDVKVSVFRNFPKITIVIEDALITGKNEFVSDTLLDVQSAGLKMSLISLIKGDDRSVEEIELLQPKLNLMVSEDGKANWDIVKSTENNQAAQSESFELQLNEIIIKDATIIYDDQAAKTQLFFQGVNFDLNGEMYGTSAKLQTDGKIERFNLIYDGQSFISNVALETETLLDIDYETITISILENELLINRLPTIVTGTVKAPGDTIFFDLDLEASESGFENFLALVPPDYDHYLEDLEAAGSASLNGNFKGYYFEDSYPVLNLGLNIENASLHYEGLPEKIENIRADATVSKPQGDWNLTEIKINEARVQIRNNPVDLSLTMKNLITDPWFDGTFVGKINLEHLKGALPLDSVNMSGMIDANLFVKGSYSAIENEKYEQINSDGIVMLSNYQFQSPQLTRVIYVPDGQLDFSPENINLSEFEMQIGESDFNLTGKVSNYLNYYFNEGLLDGSLQLNSNKVNFNELFRLMAEQETDSLQIEEEEPLAFTVPKRINISFNSNIKSAVYDQLPISDINGLITTRNGKLQLNNLSMQTLDGELNINGSYQNTTQNQPVFDFGLDISNFDIPLAYQTLSGVQKMLPVAGDSKGRFSSKLNINGRLTEMLKLVPPTVNGKGVISTQNLQIINSPVFTQISGLLNQEKLRNVTIDDFSGSIEIVDGTIVIKPFTTKVAGQETTVSGNLNTQNLIDMQLDFNVKRDAFGSEIQQILSALPGQENIQTIPASVAITGPVKNPEVDVDLSAARKKITDEVKKSTSEGLKKSLDKVGEGLKNIFK